MLEVIVFGIMAVFLALKLKSILGETVDTDTDMQKKKIKDVSESIITPPDIVIKEKPYRFTNGDVIDNNLVNQFDMLGSYMHGMTAVEFVETSCEVFDMLLSAYSNNDIKTIRELASEDVAEIIINSISSDKKDFIVLVKFLSSKITKITRHDDYVDIIVSFTSEQIRYSEDRSGVFIDGNKDHAVTVTETLTFRKYRISNDAAWSIVAING